MGSCPAELITALGIKLNSSLFSSMCTYTLFHWHDSQPYVSATRINPLPSSFFCEPPALLTIPQSPNSSKSSFTFRAVGPLTLSSHPEQLCKCQNPSGSPPPPSLFPRELPYFFHSPRAVHFSSSEIFSSNDRELVEELPPKFIPSTVYRFLQALHGRQKPVLLRVHALDGNSCNFLYWFSCKALTKDPIYDTSLRFEHRKSYVFLHHKHSLQKAGC